MAFCKLLLLTGAVALAFQGALAASKRPQYFDAIVVDAEGRSDDAGEVPAPSVQVSDCLLPMSRGPCRAYFPAYYYNPTSDKCDKFTYSGCGGNNNRFTSLKLCEQSCKDARKLLNSEDSCADKNLVCSKGCFRVNDFRDCPRCECSPKAREAMCIQPPVRGHCRALLPRWRYDAATKTCTEFKFGGCDGNGNNFISEEECLNACSDITDRRLEIADICNLPLEEPECRQAITMYFFNSTIRQCEEFMYGGCGSKIANRFTTLKACETACTEERADTPSKSV